tara:strand:- start:1596 stop:2159 length:564 start_codon:yes stop_codon:yes gene_type:complete
MADSIYNVPIHNSSSTYAKNSVVFTKSNIGNSGVPREIKYYYALKDVPSSTAITSATYWGGYITQNKEEIPYFLWTPSYNLTVSHNPKVNAVVFGNGYEQRTPDGIYNGLINLSLSFDMRSQTEARAIVQFLRARKGSESFCMKNLPEIYADEGSGYKKRFICPNFESNFVFHNNYSVKINLVEKNN